MANDLAEADRSGKPITKGLHEFEPMQKFDTGATRSADEHKFDFEGFLSPIVLERFGEYMHAHRRQRDGTLRASDNWTKGIPIHKYMKSLVRHTFDLWRAYRGQTVIDKDTDKAMTMLDIAMAILFNVQGLTLEMLKHGGNQTYAVCDATREAIEKERPFSFVPCPPTPALTFEPGEPGTIIPFIRRWGRG